MVIDRVEVEDRRVILLLKEGTGIRPLGRSYRAEVNGLIDADELSVSGEATFVWASNDLNQSAPFPNPYVPGEWARCCSDFCRWKQPLLFMT